MVKSATLTSFIPEVSVKDYWENLYKDATAVSEYHNKFHGQQEVKWTDWVDRKRVVNMEVPLALPAFLRTIAGKDTVSVQETQEYNWPNDKRLEIFSTPLSLIPGGSKYNTKLEYTIDEGDDGITVTAKVFSHASGPFGLSGAIEKVMLEIASTQTQHWLEYSRERCMAAPVKWWQQAGKFSRAFSRRMSMKRSPSGVALEPITTTLDKIESNLDILESLEPKVNLGNVARNILSDAHLKEQYAKTMMRTLFMLESAESSSLDLTPAQAKELRDMLLQLQGTLANITRRKDELLDACLEYELESSERVRALAQELQRERVSVPADPVEAIARWKPHAPPDMDWEEEMEKAEELQLEFPGWEFLIRASASAPGLSTPEGTSQAPPSTRKFLPSSSSPGDREAQRVATAKSTTSSTQQSTRSKEDLAAQSSYPPKGLKATANANGKQPAQPASVRQSSSSSALLVHSGGLFSRQSVSKMRSGNGTSQSLVHHSASTPAALNTQGRTTPALPTHDLQASATRVDAKPGAKGAGKTLAASIPVPGEKCASERLLQGLVAYSPVAEAACRAGCNDAREAGQLCLHLLLLSLIAELADQLALEDNEKSETAGQLNIRLKAQVAELKRQLAGEQPVTRGTERGGGGGTGLIVRRLFLAGVVVLVGRWGLKKRQNGARQKLGSCLEK